MLQVNQKLDDLKTAQRPNTHVELEEFLVVVIIILASPESVPCQAIIGELMEAGWSVKRPRENEAISDQDLKNVFDKVDMNRDLRVNRMVGGEMDIVTFMVQFQELRQACKFLCKQFEIDVKKVSNKYYVFVISLSSIEARRAVQVYPGGR